MKKSVTLTELMVAAVFITIAFSAIIGLFIACSQLDESSRNTTIAVAHLEYVMEQVRSSPDLNTLCTSIDNGSWDWDAEDISDEGLQALTGETIEVCCYDSVSQACLENCPAANPLDVFAQTQWVNIQGESNSFSLRTLITEYE